MAVSGFADQCAATGTESRSMPTATGSGVLCDPRDCPSVVTGSQSLTRPESDEITIMP